MKTQKNFIDNPRSPLGVFTQAPSCALLHSIGITPRKGYARSCHTEDRRTDEQKQTHVWAVVARDNALSGWGGAAGGASRCAWACAPDVNTDRVFNWVKSRTDMRRVALVNLSTYRPPAGTAHFSIYVCNSDHVAAKF